MSRSKNASTLGRTVPGLVVLALILSVVIVPKASADRDLTPIRGGETYSLGMPPVYKGRSGFEVQSYRPQSIGETSIFYNLGVSKSLGSPVVGIAALRLEGYLGVRGEDFDGGGRALFEIPSFYIGAGVDYNAEDDVADFLFQLELPLRRGGVFGRGTTLAFRWLPHRDQTFSFGVNVPLWGKNIGATRPLSDNVKFQKASPYRVENFQVVPELEDVLTDIGERANWIARLSQPFAEPEGADPHEAMVADIATVQARYDSLDARFPTGYTLSAEINAYHESLDLAFSLAAGATQVTDLGRMVSKQAREYLLNEVLLPYNYYLGQRKKNDSLISMVAIAQTQFANWVILDSEVADAHKEKVYFVFQTLCDVMEENRIALRERWEDSRFVWLPLQYALTPDQHDSQAELDDIIARGTRQPFTEQNRLWYVINEEFQWEMARSVRRAEDYHVLWIHDYRGYNGQGKPDGIAYAQTLNYLEAMIERVEAYDTALKLPQYFILLDQHYFEINKARLWLRLLSEPLEYEMSLPKEFSAWEERLAATQQRLREAVEKSVLLQMGRRQYGKGWLNNQIKVHVNITNPADPSFYSWHSVGIIPIPDNMMRDHRKIAFYDISEKDPYQGMVMVTGMGIGEHYVGANWEDRALMIQGPGALAVKDAARELLLAHGFEDKEVPFSFRAMAKPANYDALIAAEEFSRTPDWMPYRGSVVQLHNETGFHKKPINVVKAIHYSLMPSGSILKVPDSLWQSYIYASLLAGSAQRGCKVMVIAPTKDSAPSNAAPTLARAHGLMGRLIVFSNEMDSQLEEQGGLLKVGLYAPQQGVGDIAGRCAQAANNSPPWVRRVYPDNPAMNDELINAGALLDSIGYGINYLTEDEVEGQPKIHLKANFFASGTAWNHLLVRPELAGVVREQIKYLASQAATSDSSSSGPDVRDFPAEMAGALFGLMKGTLSDLTPEEREEIVLYFAVGSTNMDYRSMVMDGEVMMLASGWQSLHGILDFLLLPGLCEWLETTEELDRLLPPPSGFNRGLAGLMKLTL